LDKNGTKTLMESLGVTKSFIDTISSAYKDDKAIVNEIIKSIKQKKVNSLTILYHKKLNRITNVYPSGTKLISDHQYFETLQKVIERTPGAYLRNITQKTNGDLSAIIANPELEFQYGSLANETFTCGMSLDLSAKEMKTSFFTERLICTNGMKNTDKLCSKSVKLGDKVPSFLAGILNEEYQLESIKQFRRRLHRCYNTRASLAEVLFVESKLNGLLGNFAPVLTNEMSVHELKLAFGEKYLSEKFNHEFLRTNISLWDLVNEITAISSRIEQHRIATGEGTNLSLQVIGGDLMFKKPHLAPDNIKQIF